MVELTEALTTMPSGGQCIMSGQTYQRAFPHLQTLAEASQQKVSTPVSGLHTTDRLDSTAGV